MKLYGFFRSGTSHRLRIALNLKGLQYDQVAIDLRNGEHLSERYRAINPQGLVPALDIGGSILTQTPAIIEWLEEAHPEPPLLPQGAQARAHVRALAGIVGCDIHPVNNKRILETLRQRFGADPGDVDEWCSTWIEAGFDAYEALLTAAQIRGQFSFGDSPTIADVYLVPQLESARRFNVDTTRWARLTEINTACIALAAFQKAAPGMQPDAC